MCVDFTKCVDTTNQEEGSEDGIKKEVKKPDTDANSPTDPLLSRDTQTDTDPHTQTHSPTHSVTHTERQYILTDMTKYPLDNLCFVIRDSPVTQPLPMSLYGTLTLVKVLR